MSTFAISPLPHILSSSAVVWGMRTYAVYDKDQTIGLVLGVMAIATVCADIVCVLTYQSDNEADGVVRFMFLDSNA